MRNMSLSLLVHNPGRQKSAELTRYHAENKFNTNPEQGASKDT